MKRSVYEVVVGNIGTVYSGTSKSDTAMHWIAYVDQSKSGVGRAGNEPVTMFRDGEMVKEYAPPNAQYEEVKRFIEEETVPHQLEELLVLVTEQLKERRKEWKDNGAHI